MGGFILFLKLVSTIPIPKEKLSFMFFQLSVSQSFSGLSLTQKPFTGVLSQLRTTCKFMPQNINNNLGFTPTSSNKMHLDLNSCFASIEQQANPFLRGKPLVVAAYNSPGGCILASSIEAKKLNIKTGMRVKDARSIYPDILVTTPDPNKYRQVHLDLKKILFVYSPQVSPKSIDEFVIDFTNCLNVKKGLFEIAREIKTRIKSNLGEWLTVSIGIAPSRFLAKTASNLQKPDGLNEINKINFLKIYQNLKLTDLHGINIRNELRLNNVGIHSVVDFYLADKLRLKAAFKSIAADYWYARLRGYEVDAVDFSRKTFGNSYALPHSKGTTEELLPILQKLVEKTGARLRQAGFFAQGIHLSLFFRDHTLWHKSCFLKKTIFDSRDIYQEAVHILKQCPLKPVHTLSVNCFALVPNKNMQLEIFTDVEEKQNLVKSIDKINTRFGNFILTPARMVLVKDKVIDRIAFGGVKEI